MELLKKWTSHEVKKNGQLLKKCPKNREIEKFRKIKNLSEIYVLFEGEKMFENKKENCWKIRKQKNKKK